MRGHQCLVVEEVTKSPDQEKRTLWIDPSRALILRCLIGTQRETCYQINVEYQEDGSHGWVPSRWEIIKKVDPLDEAKVCETDSASVTAYAINGPESQEDFSLEFPPGTWVTEEVGPPPSTKTIDYITRKGGGKRLITNDDFGATYDQLVNSESGMALRTGSTGSWKWILLGLVGGSFCVWLVFRQRRKGHAARGPA